ncbi:hypothetical protein BZARG_2859 [Bizionia argentinensis JUB59]|uniref:Uncharacterized protein n=1 Tax=Bizionia argentinensis JUB59 TaxID=1046627 RepID=G2EDC7_9FLAO|nr:hypothetical protein [Bizionia argentinensis]EGV43562.1 hypothetical protein BZARG_2859 [Bizionia argentinensis JUB59]
MNHRFYSKTVKEQNRVQIKVALVALSLNLPILVLSIFSGFYFLILLSIAITLSVIAPFFDSPTLKKNGRLIYYSSLFVTEKEREGIIKIHGGSLIDYVFVIDKSLTGKQRTNFILQKYLEGILNLITACEEQHNTAVKITGTTYILNARTAEKIGLEVIKTNNLQKFILTFNYVNILISNSIAKRKLAFPKLNNIKTFESHIAELIKRREFIEGLNNKLKNSLANSL